MHAIAKHHFPIDEMASSSKQSEPVIYGPAVKRILYKDDMKSMELHADNHSTKVFQFINQMLFTLVFIQEIIIVSMYETLLQITNELLTI